MEGDVSKHRLTAFASELTVYALKSAAGRDVDVVTVGTKEFDGIGRWDVYSSTRYNIAPNAIDAWTSAEGSGFIFLSLKKESTISHITHAMHDKSTYHCLQSNTRQYISLMNQSI